MKTTGYFSRRDETKPWILAHRGLVYRNQVQVVDENTLASFEMALVSGADYLESDIQVTKDGVAVLFHDQDLKRLLGSKIMIAGLNFLELQSIKLPLGGKIPTLFEALTSFPEAKFNLDFKTRAAESIGIEVISDLFAQDRVLVSSFSEASRKRALARSPTPIVSSAGSAKVLAIYVASTLGQTTKLAIELQDIDALQVPISRYGINFTNKKFVGAVLEQNKELHYWTINEPNQMLKLFELGASGIVTDRTDIAIKVFS
jgi:glycerophosphoryl diester phosphodiesterase